MDLDISFCGTTMRTPYLHQDAPEPTLLSEGVCRQLGIVAYHPNLLTRPSVENPDCDSLAYSLVHTQHVINFLCMAYKYCCSAVLVQYSILACCSNRLSATHSMQRWNLARRARRWLERYIWGPSRDCGAELLRSDTAERS